MAENRFGTDLKVKNYVWSRAAGHCELCSLVETNDDSRLAIELYNSHLSTDNPNTQCRNILMATIAHFELKKPVNKLASLMRASQPPKAVPVQVNIAATQRIAGRDFYGK